MTIRPSPHSLKEDLFIVINDILKLQECEKLIKIYHKYKYMSSRWPPKPDNFRWPLCSDDFFTSDMIKVSQHLKNFQFPPHEYPPCSHVIHNSQISNSFYNEILKRMEKAVQKYFNSELIIDWAVLKQHEKGASHGSHYDSIEPKTVLSSITYLNSLSSGHTFFSDGTQVCPKAGRMLIFDGCKYRHGAKITTDERYTIAAWYKRV